jgi:hypothetical protein
MPSFPSATADDAELVQARLGAVRHAPSPGSNSVDSSADDDTVVQTDTGTRRRTNLDGDDVARAPSPADRLVQRWVPAPLREARWEPGRPGALVLTLVAALAAVIAAVGVWRDRPIPEPAPVLPLVIPSAAKAPSVPLPQPAPEVVVSVVGRVPHPGLIHLPEGSRVADALCAAGGALQAPT